MSFYTSTLGPITGSADASHLSNITLIPDGTQAPATIKKFELVEFADGNKIYQITYKILDGDFQGTETRQKIDPFVADDKKKNRALNMLVRVFNLCNFKPKHSEEPITEDLAPMVGSNLGIVIRQWDYQGKQGNFISEVFPLDADFKTIAGEFKVFKEAKEENIDSALTRNANNVPFVDSDLPF